MTLQEQVDKLLCNAFIGVTYAVDKGSQLSWYVLDDEERMVSIDEIINDLLPESEELNIFKSYKSKGITEVILIRGW